MLKKLGIAVLCFVISALTYGQVDQPSRYEIDQKGLREEGLTIISLEEKGVAVVRERNKYSGSKRHWEIVLLDTALKENRKVEFIMDNRYPFIGYEAIGPWLYLLFRTGETDRNDLVLIELNIDEGNETTRYEIDPELDFKITHFTKTGSALVIGGYVSRDPAVLLFDLPNKSMKVVPGFFQKDNELIELRANENETFNVVLIDRSIRSDRKMIFRTFDKTGNLLLEDIVAVDEDKSLQTSIASTLRRDDLAIFGTWGDKQGRQSIGFFSIAVDPFNEQKIRYHYFGQMQHFLDYLNPKRAARIKENTEEDVKAGRKPSFSTFVIPYNLREDKDGFVLLAEVYYPMAPMLQTPYANPYTMTPYGSPYPYYNPFYPGVYPGMRMYRPYSYSQNVKNDDNIKTYETVVVAFDGKGGIRWDHSIKIDDIERPSVEQVSDYLYNNDSLVFLYKKESDLITKRISLSDGQSVEVTKKIKTLHAEEEIRHERKSDGEVRHWYGNTFYVTGYQTVRDREKKGDKSRDVFYINRVDVF